MPLKFGGKGAVVLAAVVLAGVAYFGLFGPPRHANFSYAGSTCRGELAVLPGLHRQAGSSNFALAHSGGVSVGGVKLAATRICFTPTEAPVAGTARLAEAPWGGPLFRVTYSLAVAAPPVVLDAVPQAQPLSRPVTVRLSQPDTVFTYLLVGADGKTEMCRPGRSAQLACGVEALGLKQGTAYTLKLQRDFGGRPAGNTMPVPVTVLPSTKVTAGSFGPGEIIYGKPKTAELTLDKPLSAATAKLDLMDGGKFTPVALHVTLDGPKVRFAWDNDLPRQKSFRLSLMSATAADGSTLDTPYTVDFSTSGGPRVVGINIAGSGVPADARVVVTLDQPLAPGSNVAALAGISGGAAAVSQQGANQIVFALSGVPRCGAFTLSIAKGLEGAGGVVSDSGWSQSSRVSCRLTKILGYSVRGRAIPAYFYGNGGTTILFVGGIHGNEPSGYYMMSDWANYLDANGFKIPSDKQVVVVPDANPDGIAADQRYNANNVNLDRNYPTSDWIRDIQVAGGATVVNGGGVTPGDQPETRAMMALIETLHVRAEFSFHAQGSLVGANKIADSVAIGSAYAAGVGYQTVFYDPEQVFGYTLTGELETWEGEQFGMPAVLVELPTLSGHYFSQHVSELWNMVNLQ